MSSWNFYFDATDDLNEEEVDYLLEYEEDFHDDLGYEVYGEA